MSLKVIKKTSLRETMQSLLKPVRVNLVRMKPSFLEYCAQGLLKTDEVASSAPHLGQQVADQLEELCPTYPRPPCNPTVLVVLVLANSSKNFVSVSEIEHIICDLFPFYKAGSTEENWTNNFWKTFIKYKYSHGKIPRIFLRKKVKVSGSIEYKVCVGLNPAMKQVWKRLLQKAIRGNEEDFRASTSQPNFLETLFSGKARLDSWSKSYFKGKKSVGQHCGSVYKEPPVKVSGPCGDTSTNKVKCKKEAQTSTNSVKNSHEISETELCKKSVSNSKVQRPPLSKADFLKCDSVSNIIQSSTSVGTESQVGVMDKKNNVYSIVEDNLSKDTIFTHCDVSQAPSPEIAKMNLPNKMGTPEDDNSIPHTCMIPSTISDLIGYENSPAETQKTKTSPCASGEAERMINGSPNSESNGSHKRKRDDSHCFLANKVKFVPSIFQRVGSLNKTTRLNFVAASSNSIDTTLNQDVAVRKALPSKEKEINTNSTCEVQFANAQSEIPVQNLKFGAERLKTTNLESIGTVMNTKYTGKVKNPETNNSSQEVCPQNIGNNLFITATDSIADTACETQDFNIVQSPHKEMGIPVITEVTFLADSASNTNKEGKERRQQPRVTEVPGKGTTTCQNKETNSFDSKSEKDTAISDHNPQVNLHNMVSKTTSITETVKPIDSLNKTFTEKSVSCTQIAQNVRVTDVSRAHLGLERIASTTNTLCQSASSSLISVNRQVCVVSNVTIPKVSSCINTWKEVFPWMLYNETCHSFICKFCDWGSPQQNAVFTLKVPTDVYSVAGQLRLHQEDTAHQEMIVKRTLVSKLFATLYPIIKDIKFKTFDDILKLVSDGSGGMFPGPQKIHEKKHYTNYMIKLIAEFIEYHLIKSLAESPFFSVSYIEEKDFALIRWLNQKDISQKHNYSFSEDSDESVANSLPTHKLMPQVAPEV
ncbi:hypothetical protein Hamer_G001476 [Homarus americanus]|uniref:Fork-head domain-containing protein n=1 Tax=Homarus americanus TaxID=6706 RepID=A0A8J5TII5_HOMAM|nr:hypothetical protein Hamer_G001476 [Homarus americanus]